MRFGDERDCVGKRVDCGLFGEILTAESRVENAARLLRLV